jgi:hypothetical protein
MVSNITLKVFEKKLNCRMDTNLSVRPPMKGCVGILADGRIANKKGHQMRVDSMVGEYANTTVWQPVAQLT